MFDGKTKSIYKKIFKNKYPVVIFGLSYCGFCSSAQRYLDEKKIKYKYYKIDDIYDIFFTKLLELAKTNPELGINLSHKTFPVIFINKKFIGGYTELINIL